ncbi:hypothetical protein K456DRAFT_573748, partial [Colletotrichum gloeosporioides 23]
LSFQTKHTYQNAFLYHYRPSPGGRSRPRCRASNHSLGTVHRARQRLRHPCLRHCHRRPRRTQGSQRRPRHRDPRRGVQLRRQGPRPPRPAEAHAQHQARRRHGQPYRATINGIAIIVHFFFDLAIEKTVFYWTIDGTNPAPGDLRLGFRDMTSGAGVPD